MTKKNLTIYILPLLAFALLIPLVAVVGQQAPGGEPTSSGSTTVNENTQETAHALYDLLFPDVTVSDDVKSQITDNLLNSEPIAVPIPAGQESLSARVAELIKQIREETDPQIKTEKQLELDALTVPMLKEGLVVMEKYEQDPAVWRELLDAFESES